MKIVGIDPGINGAISILQFSPIKLLDVFNFPTIKIENRKIIYHEKLVERLRNNLDKNSDEIICCVEKVDGIIFNSKIYDKKGLLGKFKRSFSFGVSYGIALSSIVEFSPSYEFLTVKRWRGRYTKTKWSGSKYNQKKISCELAKTLFPNDINMLIPKGCRVINHDRAESLLIAYSYLL